jgi:hypothetical protein
MSQPTAAACVAGIIVLAVLLLPFVRFRRASLSFGALGWLLLAVIIAVQASEYGRGYWRFGRSLTPVLVVGPDGRYADGTPANATDLAVHRTGHAEELYLAVYAGLAGLVAVNRWLAWRDRRKQARR